MGLIDAYKTMESIDEIACSTSVCISTDFRKGMTAMKDAAIHAVERQSTVDAVPVTRCGQCKRGSKLPLGVVQCKMNRYKHRADWFCADGKRRNE